MRPTFAELDALAGFARHVYIYWLSIVWDLQWLNV